MIVLLRDDVDQAAVDDLLRRVEALGLQVRALDGARGRALEVLGEGRGRALELRGAPAVREILTRRTLLVGGEPLWPHFALRVGVVLLALLGLLFLLAAFLPPGLGDAAHADNPAAALPVEWYLRPFAGLCALLPEAARPLAGVTGLLLFLAFLLWPFLDRATERPGLRHTLLGVAVLAGLVALGVLA